MSLDGEELGSFPLDNAAPAALPGFDDQGKATVTVTVPDGTPAGTAVLTLTGETTGTTTEVPITVDAGRGGQSTTTATATPNTVKVKKGVSRINVTVTATGATPTGEVVVLNGTTELGRATPDECRHGPDPGRPVQPGRGSEPPGALPR